MQEKALSPLSDNAMQARNPGSLPDNRSKEQRYQRQGFVVFLRVHLTPVHSLTGGEGCRSLHNGEQN